MNISKVIVECINYLESKEYLLNYSIYKGNTVIEVEKVFDSFDILIGYQHRSYTVA